MCPHEPTGRLLESVSNNRSRWMVIRSQERQNPAYRATLLFTCARRLILRSFAYVKVFSFMQNLGCFDRIPWAPSWTNGQIVDKEIVAKVVQVGVLLNR